jgi:hypothetical protein
MTQVSTDAPRHRSYRPDPYLSSLPLPAGAVSERLRLETVRNVFGSLSTPAAHLPSPAADTPAGTTPLPELLYDALAAFKLRTANVAMHFTKAGRDRLFAQLDSLLASESWDESDVIITQASFATLLRMVILLDGRRPALGATSDGNIVASWTEGTDRLTIECQADDHVRYVLVQDLDGQRESAAGTTTARRLPEVLRPFDSPKRWFPHAANQAPT